MSYTNSHPHVVMYLHHLREEELERAAVQQRRRRQLRRGLPQKRVRVPGFLGTMRKAFLRKRAATAPRP